MKIKYSKQAIKDIKRLPKDFAKPIKAAIEGLLEVPPKGDIKPLRGYSDGRKRLRADKYRIIYKCFTENEPYIYIMEIGSRGDIYK